MPKNCPNCHVKLESHDHYFCSSCSAKLPPDLISPDSTSVRVKVFQPGLKQPRTLPKIPVFGKIAVQCLGVISLAALIYLVVTEYLMPNTERILFGS